ncbi:transcriptional regulator, TraR/DksA family [Magnetococcus marinus MC-1]|uniref:Transcriptional regulator, TraR/DksA family n=1 Tax=Magnetococcus marinus (strain ATCC BAA-1437 / JCM 17883 / MC-1) TaxID=156889 RepID=A0LA91_MAGMM|nr:TraR/DksA C4-type zinc finger protein [Magnetococcus marinus]ABK44884.1 transcriptional regulator, TraR/DksA family [Magnetococcus marinus MC-1]
MEEAMEEDREPYQAQLLSRRDELLADAASASESQQAVELDQTRVGRLSRMDALQMQAMAKESGLRRQQELRRIDAALVRLTDGSFGECLVCGGQIAPQRLQWDPSVATCIGCASRAESR